MTPEQWKRAKLVLEGARRHSPSDRSQYVSVACADDPELLREVESLLNLSATTTASVQGQARSTRTEWEHLTVLAEIGRGAFGRVYRAWDPALELEVALKLINVATREPDLAESVFREARLLVKVRHPHVVSVLGARRVGAEVGIWMEFIDGPTLGEVVERDGAMSAIDAVSAGIAVCDALAAVHGAGLLHRDIKARNVMREADGRVVLMDFGAGAERARLAQGEMAGTPLYMAPEFLKGAGASVASDIYSVGVLLFHLLTGDYPVSGSTIYELEAAHERGTRLRLADRRPDLGRAFIDAVERALSVDPNTRFRRAVEFKQALTDAMPRLADPSPVAVPVSSTVQRRMTPGLIVGAAFIALTVLGFLTSAAFNLMLGRTSRFVNESALVWLVWGMRGLFGPATYITLMLLAGFLVRRVFLAGRTLVRRILRTSSRGRGTPRSSARRPWPINPNLLIGLAAAAGGLAIFGILSQFSDLLGAFTDVNLADPGDHAPLAPDNALGRFFYRRSLELTMLVVGGALYWAHVIARRSGASLNRGGQACAYGVLVIALLMTTVPYRIALHGYAFARVQFDGKRCYILAQDGREVLLYCPELTVPHNRIVSSDDPRLRFEGIVENIFTPLHQAAPPQAPSPQMP